MNAIYDANNDLDDKMDKVYTQALRCCKQVDEVLLGRAPFMELRWGFDLGSIVAREVHAELYRKSRRTDE